MLLVLFVTQAQHIRVRGKVLVVAAVAAAPAAALSLWGAHFLQIATC